MYHASYKGFMVTSDVTGFIIRSESRELLRNKIMAEGLGRLTYADKLIAVKTMTYHSENLLERVEQQLLSAGNSRCLPKYHPLTKELITKCVVCHG